MRGWTLSKWPQVGKMQMCALRPIYIDTYETEALPSTANRFRALVDPFSVPHLLFLPDLLVLHSA